MTSRSVPERTPDEIRASGTNRISQLAAAPESAIRHISRLCSEHNGINLAQGFPDFACPPELKAAAAAAIAADANQYSMTWGSEQFRNAIVRKTSHAYPGWTVDPLTEVCVTCGATEAMLATCLALLSAGDEVIVFEPFYEDHIRALDIAGAVPRFVGLRGPGWRFDEKELRTAFGSRPRAIIVNSPHNPTGKVFRPDEVELIAQLCERWDVLVIADELYEHIQYGADRHRPLATIPGLEDRTVTLNALSKTYSVTGWRVGWTIAPEPLSSAIRKVHDFLTVCAPTPLQEAGIAAMQLPDDYYRDLAEAYRERRDVICEFLRMAGFVLEEPEGAFFLMPETSRVDPEGDDVALARRLVIEYGIAAVPGSAFYSEAGRGRRRLRFAYPKRIETLRLAGSRLQALNAGHPDPLGG